MRESPPGNHYEKYATMNEGKINVTREIIIIIITLFIDNTDGHSSEMLHGQRRNYCV